MTPELRILAVVGARPNSMKIAPFAAAIERHNRATADRCVPAIVEAAAS